MRVFCVAVGLAMLCAACKPSNPVAQTDPHLATNGVCEVSATLLEIPEGAIFKRELYDYTTVLKYKVNRVYRGQLTNDTIYVGHYNPFKPRSEAADRRVKDVGGDLVRFQTGQVHRMALAVPLEDNFMGGIVNKYFGQTTGPIYWAIWTNLEGR